MIRPDGGVGGFLSVQVGVDSPPLGPLPHALRMTVSNAKFNDGFGTGTLELRDAAYTQVTLEGSDFGAQEMHTFTMKTSDQESVVWNETLDFRYNGEQMIKSVQHDFMVNIPALQIPRHE